MHRDTGRSIPYRFDDCTSVTGKKQERILVPKEPVNLYSSFTILQSQGDNFSYLFFPTPDVYAAIKKFIGDSLYNDCNLAKDDAAEVSQLFLDTIKKFTIWQS